ncbi:MAG TPA: nuclear transport factor 2 family protein [Bdellovibrionales bacterium]|nr:nuclear transport factor 2 family protein [Bdellovibrionales bacterium]
MVKSPIVSEFVRLLRATEEDCDPSELVKLFSDDAELHNLTRPTAHSDSDRVKATAASDFWSQYLSAFESIETQFTDIFETGDCAVLEWHSTGCSRIGLPIDYRGATVIQHDGSRITGLRTYYDSAVFFPNVSPLTKALSETVGVPRITNEATS